MGKEQALLAAFGQKIAIVGSPGAGKSTFARALAQRAGLPLHHLDALYWSAGWKKRHDSEAWKRLQEKLVAEPEWIIDGNYYSTLEPRIAAADTVVLLDIAPFGALRNVFRRIRQFDKRYRPDMADGCHERFDWILLRTILRYPWRDRRRVIALANRYGKKLVILRPSQARGFFDADGN